MTRGGAPSRGYRLLRRAVVALGKVLFGFTVHGAEKVPEGGALIVAANHRRIADPVFVSMAVPRRLRWMAVKELFVFPVRRLALLAGAFPVDREGGGRAGLRAALALLSEGEAVGIFPEGTRRRADAFGGAPRGGVGMLAARGGAPVLPVYVGRVPGPYARLRGGRLRAHVGEPLRFEEPGDGPGGRRGRDGGAYRGFAGETLRAIYALEGEHEARAGRRRAESGR